MDGPIASAVVLPEELQPAPASPSLKRRNSSITDESAKRPRLESEPKSPSETKPAAPVRRERGRERRLFGAVLGALSQNTTTAAQKRRAEVEKKQQARRQSENEESEQRKAERIARRKEQRQREQRHIEAHMMRTRHQNLRNMAHFLQTKTEPHLYYKPWETTPEEDDTIQDQIAEAEETIKREIDGHEARKQHELQRERQNIPLDKHDADGLHTDENGTTNARNGAFSTNGGAIGSTRLTDDQEMQDHPVEGPGIEVVRDEHTAQVVQDISVPSFDTRTDETSKENDDDNGEDVVEEAAEDTVIY